MAGGGGPGGAGRGITLGKGLPLPGRRFKDLGAHAETCGSERHQSSTELKGVGYFLTT